MTITTIEVANVFVDILKNANANYPMLVNHKDKINVFLGSTNIENDKSTRLTIGVTNPVLHGSQLRKDYIENDVLYSRRSQGFTAQLEIRAVSATANNAYLLMRECQYLLTSNSTFLTLENANVNTYKETWLVQDLLTSEYSASQRVNVIQATMLIKYFTFYKDVIENIEIDSGDTIIER